MHAAPPGKLARDNLGVSLSLDICRSKVGLGLFIGKNVVLSEEITD